MDISGAPIKRTMSITSPKGTLMMRVFCWSVFTSPSCTKGISFLSSCRRSRCSGRSLSNSVFMMLVVLTGAIYKTLFNTKNIFSFYISPVNQNKKPMVYIMQCGEFFKIGMSNNPEQRRVTLQGASPYEVVLIAQKKVSNDRDFEAGLHKEFEDHHIRGEWFGMRPELIESLITKHNFDFINNISKMHDLHFSLKIERELQKSKKNWEALKHQALYRAYWRGYKHGEEVGERNKRKEIQSALGLSEVLDLDNDNNPHWSKRFCEDCDLPDSIWENFGSWKRIPKKNRQQIWFNSDAQEAVDRFLDNLESKQPSK